MAHLGCCTAAYLWVVGTGLLGYLMFQQFIERGYSWCAPPLPPPNNFNNTTVLSFAGYEGMRIALEPCPVTEVKINLSAAHLNASMCVAQGVGAGDHPVIRAVPGALRVRPICVPGRLRGAHSTTSHLFPCHFQCFLGCGMRGDPQSIAHLGQRNETGHV